MSYCENVLCWEPSPCPQHARSHAAGTSRHQTTRAVRVVSAGDKNDKRKKLELREEQIPTPGPRDVLIRVHAASLNYRDQVLLDGLYPGNAADVVPLSDGAGEVVAIGSEVTRVKVGDRVMSSCTPHWISGSYSLEFQSMSLGFTADGWLAEHITLPENGLVHIPDYMSYIEGATLACAAVTAWTALHLVTPMRPGQTVLVQGTGGVSLFALQIARMFGARVLAITSSDEKAAKLKELGAAEVSNYSKQPDWDRDILAWTGGKGVDKTVEIAGDTTIVKSANSTKVRGEIAVVGFTSGFGGGLPPMLILTRSLFLAGSAIGPRTDFEALVAAMDNYQVRPVVDNVYAFSDYSAAYERLKSGKHVGKIVIDLMR